MQARVAAAMATLHVAEKVAACLLGAAAQACTAPCCGSGTRAAVLLRLLDIDLHRRSEVSKNSGRAKGGNEDNSPAAAASVAEGSTAADRHKPSAAAAAGSLHRPVRLLYVNKASESVSGRRS